MARPGTGDAGKIKYGHAVNGGTGKIRTAVFLRSYLLLYLAACVGSWFQWIGIYARMVKNARGETNDEDRNL